MPHHALPQSYPDFSIIIVSHNARYLAQQCIQRIITVCRAFRFEIILVENGKTTPCRPSDFPHQPVRLLGTRRNMGFGAANNIGINAARSEYIFFINPDVLLHEHTCERLLTAIRTRPAAAIVAPKLLNIDGTRQWNCRLFPTYMTPLYQRTSLGNTSWGKQKRRAFLQKNLDHAHPRISQWALGSCLLASAAFLKKNHGFDERYFLYYEDIDLCKSAWALGYEVWYIPSATAHHFHARSSQTSNVFLSLLNPYTRIHIASHIRYMQKWTRGVNFSTIFQHINNAKTE